MAKVCLNCGKKIGMLAEAPLELCDGQVLCAGCAASLKPKIRNLYRVLYSNDYEEEFQTARTQILQECKGLYTEATTSAIENKINEIYRTELMPQLETSIRDKLSLQKSQEEAAKQAALKEMAKCQILTTGYDFAEYKIARYMGIISGEVVLGTGFLSEFSVSVSDFFGSQSGAFAEKLEEAKQAALDKLAVKSAEKGGNAIIGVDFDYITFSNNMIGVVANGTSVVIEKTE